MKAFIAVIALVASPLLQGVVNAAESSNSAFQEAISKWDASIDVDDIDSVLKKTFETEPGIMPQQARNRYLTMVSSLYDAQLFITFSKLLEKLPTAQKSKLKDEQGEWLVKREKLSSAEAETEKGGSLASAIYSEKFIKLTRDRIDSLNKRLLQMK